MIISFPVASEILSQAKLMHKLKQVSNVLFILSNCLILEDFVPLIPSLTEQSDIELMCQSDFNNSD